MINASNLFKTKLADGERLLAKAVVTLADGTVLTIRESDMITPQSQEQTCASTFDIGTVSQGSFLLTLVSDENDYTIYNFVDAVVVFYVGIETNADVIEWVQKGVYTVDMPLYKEYIELECYDNAYKLDKQITSLSGASAGAVVGAICVACGITLANANFKNYNLSITLPDSITDYTYREILGYICQVTCNYAKCNNQGQLFLSWYDTDFESVTDGGNLSDYSSGDNVDGGNLTNYNSGDSVDGGTFGDRSGYWHLYKFKSRPEIATDETVITGLRITQGEDTYLYGQEGYVIEISDNPLVTNCQAIANLIGPDVVGIVLRGFSGDVISNPLYEAGDKVIVSYRGNSYYTVLTNNTYKYNAGNTLSCELESKQKNQIGGNGPISRIIQKATKKTEEKLSAYEIMMENMASLICNSFGTFRSKEILEDGSEILYLHDKPTREESVKLWKMTANGLLVSNDGGETYNSGWDVNGNAVMNLLSVIGLNAEWINTGQMSGERLNFVGGKIGNLTIDLNGLKHDDPDLPFSNWEIDTGDVVMRFDGQNYSVVADMDWGGMLPRRKYTLAMRYDSMEFMGESDFNNDSAGKRAFYNVYYDSDENPRINVATVDGDDYTDNIYLNGRNVMLSLRQIDTMNSDIATIKQRVGLL